MTAGVVEASAVNLSYLPLPMTAGHLYAQPQNGQVRVGRMTPVWIHSNTDGH